MILRKSKRRVKAVAHVCLFVRKTFKEEFKEEHVCFDSRNVVLLVSRTLFPFIPSLTLTSITSSLPFSLLLDHQRQFSMETSSCETQVLTQRMTSCHSMNRKSGEQEVNCNCDVHEEALEGLHALQTRAHEAMDQMWSKACEKSEEAELYMRKAWDKWKTCHFHHLPHWLQDNDFLRSGHRPPLDSFKACFWSIFRLHTESVNIWTHLLGCLLFLCLAIYVYFFSPHPLNWEDRVVFGTFFLGAIVCLGLSSTYHTLSCHSPKVGRLCSRLVFVCKYSMTFNLKIS